MVSVCHSLLCIPCGCPKERGKEGIKTSCWFTRGWTLQELLAPKAVRFYDRSWLLLGTKADCQTLSRASLGSMSRLLYLQKTFLTRVLLTACRGRPVAKQAEQDI
jgi:hypothetical protein